MAKTEKIALNENEKLVIHEGLALTIITAKAHDEAHTVVKSIREKAESSVLTISLIGRRSKFKKDDAESVIGATSILRTPDVNGNQEYTVNIVAADESTFIPSIVNTSITAALKTLKNIEFNAVVINTQDVGTDITLDNIYEIASLFMIYNINIFAIIKDEEEDTISLETVPEDKPKKKNKKKDKKKKKKGRK